MRLILIAVGIVLLAGLAAADEDQKEKQKESRAPLISDEILNSMTRFDLEASLLTDKQEYIEIERNAYPGLDFDLPQINDLLTFQKFNPLIPFRGDAYFRSGGLILTYWGIHKPSSVLFSTTVP